MLCNAPTGNDIESGGRTVCETENVSVRLPLAAVFDFLFFFFSSDRCNTPTPECGDSVSGVGGSELPQLRGAHRHMSRLSETTCFSRRRKFVYDGM